MSAPGLPPLLQPWAGWLSLFPDDLAATLGQLLLRLQPLVGPLRRHAARVALEPAGVGDIVRRGSYERLLISEWALADSAPDEFLRRAANNELLFTGPEPANSETSLRSVALFDAGPAQLGEPRLAHLALFILLARRAELAGAEFRWGILQQPGVLHHVQGVEGVRRLLDARTHATLDTAGVQAWNALLEDAALDCWLVGDPGAACPAPVRSRVLVRRSWFAPQLDVELVGRRRSVGVALPLPAAPDCVRLLRRPFDRPAGAAASTNQLVDKPHSLKYPPIFGRAREWLAVIMVDRSMTLYQLPDAPGGKSGRPRRLVNLAHLGSVVAAGLHRKSVGIVTMSQGQLHFSGFPGPIFSRHSFPLTDPAEFQMVPATVRWAPAFYWMEKKGPQGSTEEVLVLDKEGRLGCWSCTGFPGRSLERSEFRIVAKDVIGAIQYAERLLFAVKGQGRTDIYSIARGKPVREHLYPIMHEGSQLLFAEPKTWRGGRATWALRLDEREWLVGDAMQAERVTLAEGDLALGCVRGTPTSRPGLLVLHPNRSHVSLLAGGTRQLVLESAEPIAQISFDPLSDRLAWLGQKSGALTVRAIDAREPLLRVATKENEHAG